MNQILTNFIAFNKAGFLLGLLFLLLAFQSGITQHCTPGFHFTVDQKTVIFDDQSTADGTITAYNWDFGDGYTSTEQNPSHTYAVSGTYNVCLTITAENPNCTGTFCHHVVIQASGGVCHAAFTYKQTDPKQQTIDFTDQSTSDGTIGSWFWDFGDGNTSTEQNPSHAYALAGVYKVCLTITDDDGGCTSHVCHHVVVHHPPAGVCHAAFTWLQTDPNKLTIDFTDKSTSDGTIGSWEWSFGDGTTSFDQNPSHTYALPGTYTVCLTITDDDGGCTSHVCHHVVVHHPPAGVCHAAFTWLQTDPSQLTIDFTDKSTSDGTIGSWAWDFGDGSSSTEQNPSHTYAQPGNYLVCLTITDDDGGCTSHVCHHVIVHHPEMHGQSSHQPHNDSDFKASDKKEFIVTYPNPVISSTTVQYELTEDNDVKIEIYDMFGNRIHQILNEKESKGIHTQLINVDNLKTGFYFLKLVVGAESFIKKITVEK